MATVLNSVGIPEQTMVVSSSSGGCLANIRANGLRAGEDGKSAGEVAGVEVDSEEGQVGNGTESLKEYTVDWAGGAKVVSVDVLWPRRRGFST
jgi:hypothetical protein